jgi:hypothetical protein
MSVGPHDGSFGTSIHLLTNYSTAMHKNKAVFLAMQLKFQKCDVIG